MKIMGRRNVKVQQTSWVTILLSLILLFTESTASADGTRENDATAPIRIVDQYGQQAPSGKRHVESQIFDVTVGPLENEFTFAPDTVNISVGDTVRWTWASDFHSVTSGASCIEDERFCSPDNMNCDDGILNNTGFVYEYTFTQPGMYQYFCDLHCVVGMTGVVNVLPAVRTPPMQRPHPTPPPRP